MGLFLGNDINSLFLGNEEVISVYLGSEKYGQLDIQLAKPSTSIIQEQFKV